MIKNIIIFILLVIITISCSDEKVEIPILIKIRSIPENYFSILCLNKLEVDNSYNYQYLEVDNSFKYEYFIGYQNKFFQNSDYEVYYSNIDSLTEKKKKCFIAVKEFQNHIFENTYNKCIYFQWSINNISFQNNKLNISDIELSDTVYSSLSLKQLKTIFPNFYSKLITVTPIYIHYDYDTGKNKRIRLINTQMDSVNYQRRIDSLKYLHTMPL